MEIHQCVSSALEAETAAINSVYNRYRARLDAVQRGQLKNVQLAWIKYKDLACKFDASGVEGGSSNWRRYFVVILVQRLDATNR